MIDETTRANLFAAAKAAKENAYVPYSKFRVGAAILLSDGTIETGCNVENASYGAAICAERTALTKITSNGRRDVVAVCVTGDTDDVITPCGICRQFIFEFGDDIPVIFTNKDGEELELTINELLPYGFRLEV